MVAKVALLYAIASACNGYLGGGIFEPAKPLGNYVLMVCGNVVPNFEPG
jgi:hypothetical protein